MASVRLTRGGFRLRVGEPDTPNPEGMVAETARPRIVAAVSPPDPRTKVLASFRVDGGAEQVVSLRAEQRTREEQYFEGVIPGLRAGQSVEYRVRAEIETTAGRVGIDSSENGEGVWRFQVQGSVAQRSTSHLTAATILVAERAARPAIQTETLLSPNVSDTRVPQPLAVGQHIPPDGRKKGVGRLGAGDKLSRGGARPTRVSSFPSVLDLGNSEKLRPAGKPIGELQNALLKMNLEIKSSDLARKELGASTIEAVRSFQARVGLPADGRLTPETIAKVNVELAHNFVAQSKVRTQRLQDLLQQVGQQLDPDEIKGRKFGPNTEQALRAVQAKLGMPQDGCISEAVLN